MIEAGDIEAALGACETGALEALKLAHARVMAYHLRQKPTDVRFTDPLGVELGWRWRPIDAVGLYVPGGAATDPARCGGVGGEEGARNDGDAAQNDDERASHREREPHDERRDRHPENASWTQTAREATDPGRAE